MIAIPLIPTHADDEPASWQGLRRRWPAVLPKAEPWGAIECRARRTDSGRTLHRVVALTLAKEAAHGI